MNKLTTYICALTFYLGLATGCASKTDSRICSDEELNNKNYVECSIEQSDYASCVFPKRVMKSRSLEDFPDQIGKVKVSDSRSSFIDMRYINENALRELRKDLDDQGIQRLVLKPIENPSGIIKALGGSKRRVCMRKNYQDI